MIDAMHLDQLDPEIARKFGWRSDTELKQLPLVEPLFSTLGEGDSVRIKHCYGDCLLSWHHDIMVTGPVPLAVAIDEVRPRIGPQRTRKVRLDRARAERLDRMVAFHRTRQEGHWTSCYEIDIEWQRSGRTTNEKFVDRVSFSFRSPLVLSLWSIIAHAYAKQRVPPALRVGPRKRRVQEEW